MKMLRLQRSKCLGIPAGQPWTSDGMSCHGMVCSKAQPCRCSHPRVRLPTGSKGSKGLSSVGRFLACYLRTVKHRFSRFGYLGI